MKKFGRTQLGQPLPLFFLLLAICVFFQTGPVSSFVQWKQIFQERNKGIRLESPSFRLRNRSNAAIAAATRRDIFRSVPFAAATSGPTTSSTTSTTSLDSSSFIYSTASVVVSGVTVPVSIWQPSNGSTTHQNPATYPYAIDIGKIATKLRVNWLSWLPCFDRPLPCGSPSLTQTNSGNNPLPTEFSPAQPGDAILFAHGFLGSPYDFAHAAEVLAADGYVVVAPELPESLTASFVPVEGMGREEIVNAAMRIDIGGLNGDDEASKQCPKRWGIFGHSAGAGTALTHPAEFLLGRVCLAGGAGLLGGYTKGRTEPLFACSSNGDGCNSFMGMGVADLRSVLDDGETTIFSDLREAYNSPSVRVPPKAAYVFASDGTSPVEPLPCHISFLWEAVDDAMVDLLSPLLPLAKALGLFLLDFDVYKEQRDAAATAEVVVPAIRRFFLTNSARS